MLSDRILFLRKKAGITQAQLAKELNISPSAEGMYEQGRRVPSLEILIRLSRIFDVSLDYLITGSEFTPSSSKVEIKRIPENCPCSSCYWKEYIDP